MDFGVVGFDGFVGADNNTTTTTTTNGFASSSSSDALKNQKWYGSTGFLKQERSGGGNDNNNNDDDWRSSKVVKTDHDFSKAMLRSNNTIFDGQQQQQMLSFSTTTTSPKSENVSTLPYYHLPSSVYSRNTGYSSGSFNGGNMHGVLTGVRGPFTPSQWVELEHQALIYKYINANVPIPTNLLIPIRKALDSFGFSSFSGSLLRTNTLGWGAFHLGFSNSTDPEPGRCRRTDGKKWRCSRDAVADQKYCERHMNRGRHRSRKPVEGQSGHSATTTTSTTSKLIPTGSSLAMGPTGGGGGASSSSLAVEHQQQFKNLQPGGGASNLSAAPPMNRMFLNKDNVDGRKQDTPSLSVLSPTTMELKSSKDNSLLFSKQQIAFNESSRSQFGIVSSDSLLNPTHRSSSLMTCRNFGSSHNPTNQESGSQHSLRQFMDEWPKNQPNRSAISWPDIDMQSDRTQLSISIPVTSSDFMSSTSSPNNDNKVTLSPLRLSREFDPIQMGLGVGSVLNESSQRQASWIPISWESSMGGPLGEVLNNTNNNSSTGECKNSALNLMTEGWDNSPRLSPTGVLQKTAFGSLSNSSAGSSPRTENNKGHEGASLCTDLLG